MISIYHYFASFPGIIREAIADTGVVSEPSSSEVGAIMAA
jgi:hypothetical protein